MLFQRIILTLFLGAVGGKFGDSSSTSRAVLLEVVLTFRLFLGMTVVSFFPESCLFSSSIYLCFLVQLDIILWSVLFGYGRDITSWRQR